MRFGEFAVDVTDRVFDLLDDVQASGTGDSVPLPERFRTRAVDLRLASGNPSSGQREASRGVVTTSACG